MPNLNDFEKCVLEIYQPDEKQGFVRHKINVFTQPLENNRAPLFISPGEPGAA